MAENEPAPAPKDRSGKVGKVAAVVTVVMILVTAAVIVVVVISVRNSLPVEVESIAESIDTTERCSWRLTIELRNNSDEDLTIERVAAILNRGRKNAMIEQAPTLRPDEFGTYVVTFRLPEQPPCPSVDDINHGDLIFHLEDGSKQSVRF